MTPLDWHCVGNDCEMFLVREGIYIVLSPAIDHATRRPDGRTQYMVYIGNGGHGGVANSTQDARRDALIQLGADLAELFT